MSTLTTIAFSLVIVLHIVFMMLEFFMENPFRPKNIWHKAGLSQTICASGCKPCRYNGFLAAGPLSGLVRTGGNDALVFFLNCIIIAGTYGAITVKLSILWLQILPAAITMFLLIFNS